MEIDLDLTKILKFKSPSRVNWEAVSNEIYKLVDKSEGSSQAKTLARAVLMIRVWNYVHKRGVRKLYVELGHPNQS
jgi:hypothetical protein